MLMFAGIIYVLFYYHDKNILSGAAYETAVVGSECMEYTKEELETYLKDRVHGKLILFSKISVDAWQGEDALKITAKAQKGYMKIRTEINMNRIRPETYIRNRKKLFEIGKELGET